MMGVCPKCGKEITMLNNWSNVHQKFIMTLDKEGLAGYEETTDYCEGTGENFWDCPLCSETVAHSEDEAVKILKKQPEWSVS